MGAHLVAMETADERDFLAAVVADIPGYFMNLLAKILSSVTSLQFEHLSEMLYLFSSL